MYAREAQAKTWRKTICHMSRVARHSVAAPQVSHPMLGWNPASNSEGGEGFIAGEVQRRRGPLNIRCLLRPFLKSLRFQIVYVIFSEVYSSPKM